MVNLIKKQRQREFNIPAKEAYGFLYLQKSKNMIVRTNNSNALILDRSLNIEKEMNYDLVSQPIPGYKFMQADNDDKIFTNSDTSNILVYTHDRIEAIPIELTSVTCGIELIPDKEMIIVGDMTEPLTVFLKKKNSNATQVIS